MYFQRVFQYYTHCRPGAHEQEPLKAHLKKRGRPTPNYEYSSDEEFESLKKIQ